MIVTKNGTVVISEENINCEIRDFHFDVSAGPEVSGYVLALEFAKDRIESLLREQQADSMFAEDTTAGN